MRTKPEGAPRSGLEPKAQSPKPASDWRSSPLKRFEAWAIAALGYPLIAALGATLRWRVDGMEHLDRIVAAGRQPVMVFWHGRILPATYYFRRRGIVVITSENFDGEWIARIIERFGYGTARGSTTRGAQRALLQLKRAMEEGKSAGFTVDGPRGPLRSVQPGAVWLARATSNPILPFHIEAARSWALRSWDRTQIPKPFATLALAIGEPIDVPPETNDQDLERKRQELEASLAALEEKALGMLKEAATGARL